MLRAPVGEPQPTMADLRRWWRVDDVGTHVDSSKTKGRPRAHRSDRLRIVQEVIANASIPGHHAGRSRGPARVTRGWSTVPLPHSWKRAPPPRLRAGLVGGRTGLPRLGPTGARTRGGRWLAPPAWLPWPCDRRGKTITDPRTDRRRRCARQGRSGDDDGRGTGGLVVAEAEDGGQVRAWSARPGRGADGHSDARGGRFDRDRASASLPNPPEVLVLTTFDADEHVLRALRAGAAGFLLRTPRGDRSPVGSPAARTLPR